MICRLEFFVSHPCRALDAFLSKYLYPYVIARKKEVRIEGQILLRGFPIIEVMEGSSVTIQNNVTLDSRNRGYHINLHSPVKLLADRPGAEICIGENTRIHGSCIHAQQRIVIGRNCLIAGNCQVFDGGGFIHIQGADDGQALQGASGRAAGDLKRIDIRDKSASHNIAQP